MYSRYLSRPYLLSVLALFVLVLVIFSAPANFPLGSIITIPEGSGLKTVSATLKKEHVIRSRIIFEALVIMQGGERHVDWGDYLFDRKESVFKIAKRFTTGERRLAPVKVTIPEGYTREEIKNEFTIKLKDFSAEKFLVQAKEGYLFPDTYFFFTTDTEVDALASLTKNYEKKVGPLRPKIASLGKTENQIITMASIIEHEAHGDADRELISGILWRRLSIGRALEVDAAPITYKEKGLPAQPISNPGLEAINAAMYPKTSEYLYYLHDKDGGIHFARTFEEHKLNKQKYLQ